MVIKPHPSSCKKAIRVTKLQQDPGFTRQTRKFGWVGR